MRIIAGKARSLLLKTPTGKDTRPTTDKVKETLFNMIQDQISGAKFLDLCAGSGAIGLEALSRGAGEVVFVEKDRKALACIKENIVFTKFEIGSHIIGRDALTALRILSGKTSGGAFDIIFMDPPYDIGLEKDILKALAKSELIDEDTLIVVEASLKTDFSYLEKLGYSVVKIKEYKTNRHLFLKCDLRR